MAIPYDKLSKSMEMKTNELIKRKIELDNKKKSIKIPLILDGICVLYILLNIDSFESYYESIFTDSQTRIFNMKRLDSIVVLCTIAAALLLYIYLYQIKKSKKKFEQMRQKVIASIENESCNCHHSMPYIDEYILSMKEEYDINVVF